MNQLAICLSFLVNTLARFSDAEGGALPGSLASFPSFGSFSSLGSGCGDGGFLPAEQVVYRIRNREYLKLSYSCLFSDQARTEASDRAQVLIQMISLVPQETYQTI